MTPVSGSARRSGRAAAGLAAGLAALTAAAGVWLGDTYLDRLNVPEGLLLVATDDAPPRAPAPRPRRVIVVLADGLRADAARGMAAAARLAAAGQCRETAVGQPSLSRAIYTSLSAGVEPDRTGVRDNAFVGPAPVDSIWAAARRAGRTVAARSELPWFRELFPGAFDPYQVIPRGGPAFAAVPPGDVLLLHPVFVDEAGHEHGGASPEYAAAARRLDGELDGFLAGLDLGRDLVLFTADHGHTDRGGHGGAGPEVARVLTCLAGPGVLHREGEGPPLRTVDLAPLLALLAGLPYPRHARPGDEALLDDLIDPAAFPPGYLPDRAAARARVRAAEEAALPGGLPAAYARGRERQAAGLGGIAAVLGALGALAWWRRGPAPVLQGTAGAAATLVALRLGRGCLDLSAVNHRGAFLAAAAACCALPAAALVLVRLRRAGRRALGDQAVVTAAALIVAVGHPLVFGYRPGAPLPPPFLVYLPLVSSVHALAQAALLLGLSGLALLGLPRGAPAVRE